MVCLGRVLPRHCNEIRGAVLDHSELIAFLGFQSWDRKACQYGSLAHLVCGADPSRRRGRAAPV